MNGQRKNNPVAKQLSDPMWRKRIVNSRILYTRKIKHKEEQPNANK